jgi:hypothetical protein|tara:strand:+ start:1244 stop:1489 length:246 start_codon:yes stop_codon:yes gene_type:complete
MKNLIPFLLLGFLFSSSSAKFSIEQTDVFVYTCSNPSLKCYYKIPCSIFFQNCNQNKGKVMKVKLERAKALGKEECSCNKN